MKRSSIWGSRGTQPLVSWTERSGGYVEVGGLRPLRDLAVSGAQTGEICFRFPDKKSASASWRSNYCPTYRTSVILWVQSCLNWKRADLRRALIQFDILKTAQMKPEVPVEPPETIAPICLSLKLKFRTIQAFMSLRRTCSAFWRKFHSCYVWRKLREEQRAKIWAQKDTSHLSQLLRRCH